MIDIESLRFRMKSRVVGTVDLSSYVSLKDDIQSGLTGRNAPLNCQVEKIYHVNITGLL